MSLAAFRNAGPADLGLIEAALSTRPYSVSPARPWGAEEVRRYWLEALLEKYDEVLATPTLELVLEEVDGRLLSWLLLQHEGREGSTGRLQSRIFPPSWIGSAEVVEEAARRARAHGAEILSADLAVGPEEAPQVASCEAAGMVAEFQRIVLDLDRVRRDLAGSEAPAPAGEAGRPREATARLALARAVKGSPVRRADPSDRLFLMHLSTECVGFMFHERRQDEMPQVQQRFFDSYAIVDLSPSGQGRVWIAETPEGTPAGAILVDTEAEEALDGRWNAYIYDISVLPQHWGRATGAALVMKAITDLDADGPAWLTGDVSTDNERVLSLSRRFGFVVETRHYVRLLNREEKGS